MHYAYLASHSPGEEQEENLVDMSWTGTGNTQKIWPWTVEQTLNKEQKIMHVPLL